MGHASQNLSNNGQQDSMVVQNARFGGVVKVNNSQKSFQSDPKKYTQAWTKVDGQ